MSSRFTERFSLKKSWERHLRKILEVNLWPPHPCAQGCAHQICTHTDMDTDTQSKWSVYKETRVLVKRAQHQIIHSPAVTLWEGWERTSLSQGSRESRAEEATRTLSATREGWKSMTQWPLKLRVMGRSKSLQSTSRCLFHPGVRVKQKGRPVGRNYTSLRSG